MVAVVKHVVQLLVMLLAGQESLGVFVTRLKEELVTHKFNNQW